MQILIDITSTKTIIRRGTSKSTNRPYEISTQRGFLHQTDKITGEISRLPIDIVLPRDALPYEVGTYTLDASSLGVSTYGNLELRRVELHRLPNLAAKSASSHS